MDRDKKCTARDNTHRGRSRRVNRTKRETAASRSQTYLEARLPRSSSILIARGRLYRLVSESPPSLSGGFDLAWPWLALASVEKGGCLAASTEHTSPTRFRLAPFRRGIFISFPPVRNFLLVYRSIDRAHYHGISDFSCLCTNSRCIIRASNIISYSNNFDKDCSSLTCLIIFRITRMYLDLLFGVWRVFCSQVFNDLTIYIFSDLS